MMEYNNKDNDIKTKKLDIYIFFLEQGGKKENFEKVKEKLEDCLNMENENNISILANQIISSQEFSKLA